MSTVLFIPPETRGEKEFIFTPRHGARVYDPRPMTIPAKDPEDVYMIYLSIQGSNFFRRQYRTRRDGAVANVVARDLCDRAKAGNTKYEVGKNLVGITWTSDTYLYVVVDISGCSFSTDTDEKHDPIAFHKSKDVPCSTATLHFDKNSCFYDGQILSNTVLNAPGFRCINHFTDEDGEPLLHPRVRTYGFEIRYLFGGALEIVDPDGQNQGPPS